MKHSWIKCLVAFCVVWLFFRPVHAQSLKVGVYYFPGWTSGQVGNAYTEPWDKIRPFPDREPMLGWYRDDDPKVLERQLSWMGGNGIDFVVFGWLWGRNGEPYLEHSVRAYLRAEQKHGVQFSVLWANHTNYIFSRQQFERLFSYWVSEFFLRPGYLRIDGKPAIFIFSADVLNKNAGAIGLQSAELLGIADRIARRAGLPGIAFIGGVGANQGGGFDYSSRSGYHAWSAYNMHGPATRPYDSLGRRMSHSYAELDFAYRDHWSWMMEKAELPYIVPVTSGWDKRPWGGSKDPAHDDSRSTPGEFAVHLRAARQVLADRPDRTKNMAVICCWNEFGEGSFIEPTKAGGFKMLEQVRIELKGR